jgi:TonB family protein
MREAWKELEGRVVNKEFRLGDYLGGSEKAGVFATELGVESRRAAVKLIAIGAWDEAAVEAELARLKSARELTHPHLIQILQLGRTTVDDNDLLYVVMEQADEDLSQILPNRPLAEDEVREMLPPMLETLAYLHGKGFVHGRLKPANVMAVGDQLKLSKDGIHVPGVRRAAGENSEFDAPELARGEVSAAADIWSLGMLIVAALTQRVPAWDASGEAILPENLPAAFDQMAHNCLRRDPRERWALAAVAASAGIPVPAVAAAADMTSAETQRGGAVTATQTMDARVAGAEVLRPSAAAPVALSRPRVNVALPRPAKRRNSNMGLYVSVAGALVIAMVILVPKLFRGNSAASQARNSQTDIVRKDSAAKRKSSVARPADESARSANAARASAQAIADKGDTPNLSVARETTLRRGLAAGHPADQVIPNVPESARKTIHGTVRVGVRVSVDSSGEVTEAELDSAGPSKYFAQMALDAAQQWKFDPPKMQGRNVLSDWLLQFQFTRTGTKVIPTQSDP